MLLASKETEAGHSEFCCSRRRKFLGELALLTAGALVPRRLFARQTPSTAPVDSGWIDVHHHFAPPTYTQLLSERKILPAPLVGWSAEKTIEDMDRGGVAAAMNSIVVPGVWFGDVAQARRLARDSNEYAAKLVSDHPKRFGNFATLTLPDIEGSLREIEYSLDALKADGILLWTSYGEKWLGDPFFAPVFEELDRRKAVVFVHPVENACCTNFPREFRAAIEYGTDTTRAIVRMIYTGASSRYPNIRMIFSHAGGTLPFLIGRFVRPAPPAREGREYRPPPDFQAEISKFFYDTAQTYNRVPMEALRHVVPVSQIVFGTDFPYRSSLECTKGLAAARVFDASELRTVGKNNALNLLPRLRTS